MKTKIIPVVIGALGMIKKGTKKYVNETPGNLSLAEIKKIMLNSTAHILKMTLSLLPETIIFSFYIIFLTLIILYLNTPKLNFYTNFIQKCLYIFIQMLYIQHLENPKSPPSFPPKLYETRKKHTRMQMT